MLDTDHSPDVRLNATVTGSRRERFGRRHEHATVRREGAAMREESEAERVARIRRNEALSRAADADLAYRIAIERHTQVTRLLGEANRERDAANASLGEATVALASLLTMDVTP
jgi:hypothetical protein